MPWVYLAVALVVAVAAVLAIRSRSLVGAAVALAIGNSGLAVLFFLLGAPYAGAVQLSVGAGLVSTLFILAISLAESIRGGEGEN